MWLIHVLGATIAVILSEVSPMPSRKSVISVKPAVMSGTPVFRGTRVPVQTLLDYLEAGDSLDDFLEDFPTVNREQARELLELAKEALLASSP